MGMPLMIFDDILPNLPEILEYHDVYKLLEIN